LLDDLALARQRAMVNRSTVYMVFVPPQQSWASNGYNTQVVNNQVTNLLMHQYCAYALVSLSSVGDQPGQHYPRYLTDWRRLPSGVFFAPFEFYFPSTGYTNIYTTNTLSGTIITNTISPWNTVNNVPFPSLYGANVNMTLPCIGFTPQGTLTTNSSQYIVLAHGSIFYPTDTNGNPLFQPPNVFEVPPGNDVSSPNIIQIDALTARSTLVQNQFQ
jgi:hypothetical protein